MQQKKNKTDSWKDFWQEQKTGFDCIMRNTTQYFFEKHFMSNPVPKDKIIMDYGCATGILTEALSSHGNRVTGVDISHDYIKYCKEKFFKNPDVSFELIDQQQNTFQKILFASKPDYIVVMSVIQYFECDNDLTDLLDQIKNYSNQENKQVKVLIADIIPENHSKFYDVKDLFFNSLSRGYMPDFFRFMYGIVFSGYKNNKLEVRKFNRSFFENYAASHFIPVHFPEKLTVHSTRYSVELVF